MRVPLPDRILPSSAPTVFSIQSRVVRRFARDFACALNRVFSSRRDLKRDALISSPAYSRCAKDVSVGIDGHTSIR